MAHVRVRLQTARVRLVFEGEESVFDRQIEPLLLRVARGRASTRGQVAAVAEEQPAEPAAAAAAHDGWQPAATSFGTFQRQLTDGPEGTESLITAYAFYLWNYEKRETFGTEELGGCFEAGGSEVPQDLAESCADLESKRILQPAAHEGTWRLTPKGTNQVRKLLR
jgi:hypothetical protein